MKTIKYIERHNGEEWERLGEVKYDEANEEYKFYRTSWSGLHIYDMSHYLLSNLLTNINATYGWRWDAYTTSNFKAEK